MTKYQGRNISFDILSRVFWNGGFSNVLLAGIQAKHDVSREDVSAAVNLTYGVLRNIFLIDEVLKSKSSRKKLTLSPPVMTIARMACCELLFMEAPDYAVVSHYVEMAKNNGSPEEASFLNACLRKVAPEDAESAIGAKKNDAEKLALKYSLPLWFVKEILRDYGAERAEPIYKASNEAQPSYYRMNARKTSRDEITASYEYKFSGLQEADAPAGCFMIEAGRGAFPKALFDSGAISPQDRSTQFVPPFLRPNAGDRILDLCCGSGTKTLQLAEMTDCDAVITAVDNVEQKLKSLSDEMARLGLSGVETVLADVVVKPDLGVFDKVFLDAPCSGSGTLRRRPEIRMRITKQNVIEMNAAQDALLDAAADYVSDGGTLAYSTCSILKMENENRVFSFLKRRDDFRPATREVLEDLRIDGSLFVHNEYGVTFLPHMTNACGSFVSVLKKR